MRSTSRELLWALWALWAVVAAGVAGCGEEEQPEADMGAVNPCGDACPIEQCNVSFRVCTGGGDMGGDADVEADSPDAPDAPDADVEVPDVDADLADEGADVEVDADAEEPPVGCVGDEECGEGEICDVSGEVAVCRAGCREDEDCAEGESCDPVGLVCAVGCFEDEDCGPESSRQVCRVEDRSCVRAECRVSTQCAVGSYCDREVFPPACAVGCDTGLCPRGEYCELESRQCFGGCEDDQGCEDPETWCDVTDHVCRPGCRDGECPSGEVCYLVEGEGEPTRECVPEACAGDEGCGEGQYCGEEVRFGRMICLEGCRLEPDSCPEGQRCDVEARACVEAVCEGDEDCGAGEICGGNGACREGCRADEDCPGSQRCDEGSLLCVCEVRADCAQGETCVAGRCVPACASDADCARPGEVCNLTTGQCAQGCTGDVDCDYERTAQECDRRTRSCVLADCARDRDCPEVAWCDVAAGQCALGCREMGCEVGQYCDLGARQCVAGCSQDEECGANEYCDEAVSRCFVGCRGDEVCVPGSTCQEVVQGDVPTRQCLPPSCGADTECEAGLYCGVLLAEVAQTYCVPGCRLSPDDCPQDRSCDPESRQCVRSACGADVDCGDEEVCDEGRCRRGCRGDEQCAQGRGCDEGARSCLCAQDGECQQGQVCAQGLCVEPCVDDQGCGESQRCDVASGLCERACEGDEACGEGARCDLGRGFCVGLTCASDEECVAERFCDLERGEPSCQPGCRAGGCPRGQQCLLSQRVCAERCVVNEDCEAGRYCDDADGQCRVGCRGEQDCVNGQVCLQVLQEGQQVRACVEPGCASDVGCPAGQFCGFDEASGRDLCQEGCRLAPDNCLDGQRCDEVTRACVEDLCVNDGDCPAGRVCAPGVGGLSCEIGCNEDSQCGQGFACQDGRCGCAARGDCAPGLACDDGVCQAPCAADGQCGVDEICDQALGVCRGGCRVDDDCAGQGLVCDPSTLTCLGRLCERDAQCAAAQYCGEGAPGARRCAEGCREGSCPGGQFCDLEARECVRGCLQDRNCLVGTYCDVGAQTCRVGCRGDLECGVGLRCQEVELNGEPARRCLAPACRGDQDCAADQFCGEDVALNRRVCLGGCRVAPDNCPPQQRCDAEARSCQAATCGGDEECGQGEICQFLVGGQVCVPGCRMDGQCAPTGRCEEDLQRCGCDEDSQCFDGEVCVGGLCEEPCTTAGCPEGEVCEPVSGLCAVSCAVDEDCDPAGTGQRCDVEAGVCVLTVCASDEDCLEVTYCELGLEQPVCAPGCREGGCPEGQFCQPQQRVCQEGCAQDTQCQEGQFCGPEDGLCRDGCREGEACPQGLSCQQVRGEAGIEQLCLPPRCTADADCAADQFCLDDPFLEGSVCLLGCRVSPDSCPQGRVCSPTVRQCLASPACEGDEGCGEGEVCREDLGGFCGAGCREQSECGPGQSCDPFALRCTCFGPSDCGDGQVCDGFYCIDACQVDLDCPPGLSCEEGSGLCVFACEEDEYEPNDDFLSAAALALPGAEGLRMCNLDGQGRQDCYAVELGARRYGVLLEFSQREGDLNLEIFDPDLLLVQILSSADDNEETELMARAGRYTFCVTAGGVFASEYALRFEPR